MFPQLSRIMNWTQMPSAADRGSISGIGSALLRVHENPRPPGSTGMTKLEIIIVSVVA